MTKSYSSYQEVPYYRRQWFFWVLYFVPLINLVPLGLLLFGDIYYEKKGEVKSFGVSNRVVAGLIAAYFLYSVVRVLISGGD